MSSPVNLSDLPVATSAAPNDLMLLRKGLTDYQVAVNVIQSINITILNPIPFGFANATDLFLISRSGQNYNIRFSQVGIPKNSRMWFYNALPPVGWSIVPNTGGRLLAAQDSTTTYAGNLTPGTFAGTWQQTDTVLTINQIPAHSHNVKGATDTNGNKLSDYARYGDKNHPGSQDIITKTTGGGQGHNHGNLWRPASNVGVVGNKDG